MCTDTMQARLLLQRREKTAAQLGFTTDSGDYPKAVHKRLFPLHRNRFHYLDIPHSTLDDSANRKALFERGATKTFLQISLAIQLPELAPPLISLYIINSHLGFQTESLHKPLVTPRRNGSHTKKSMSKVFIQEGRGITM